jgi:hypothetical protein
MSCTTISQLWKKGNKEYEAPKVKIAKGDEKSKFYNFKEFVTLHNEAKLDAKYYNGQSVCPKTTVSNTTVSNTTVSPNTKVSIQYLPLGLIVIAAALLGYGIAKK